MREHNFALWSHWLYFLSCCQTPKLGWDGPNGFWKTLKAKTNYKKNATKDSNTSWQREGQQQEEDTDDEKSTTIVNIDEYETRNIQGKKIFDPTTGTMIDASHVDQRKDSNNGKNKNGNKYSNKSSNKNGRNDRHSRQYERRQNNRNRNKSGNIINDCLGSLLDSRTLLGCAAKTRTGRGRAGSRD